MVAWNAAKDSFVSKGDNVDVKALDSETVTESVHLQYKDVG